MSIWLICHLITCFLLAGSLCVGLTRKEAKQVSTWNWISRVCYAIMLCSGIVLAIPAIQAHTLNTIIKLVLSCATICCVEVNYKRKKENNLTKKTVIPLICVYTLTVVCGFVLSNFL
jgi:hypothetical protein